MQLVCFVKKIQSSLTDVEFMKCVGTIEINIKGFKGVELMFEQMNEGMVEFDQVKLAMV